MNQIATIPWNAWFGDQTLELAFPHDWHRALIEEFATAIGEGRPPAVTGRQALDVHRLIDALIASAADRSAVTLGSAS